MKNIQIPAITWVGLVLAFFGAPLAIFVFNQFTDGAPLTNELVITRELILFGITGILLLLVTKGEGETLESIGLHNRHWGKSLLLALIILVSSIALLAAILGIYSLLNVSYGEGGESSRYDHISLVVMTLVVIRAGVIEEICYRGYIIERIEKYTGSKLGALLVPAVIFGIVHYRQGVAGVIIATSAGLLLAVFYQKRRDLKPISSHTFWWISFQMFFCRYWERDEYSMCSV